ncbi:MAG: cache domain-containing protein, partial [Desulfuromonadales bacterium]|nr:cache domain-containing protein [Desulfuromonadales bacterium]
MKFNRKSALVVTFTIVITLMVCFSLLFSSKPPADNLKQQTFAALQQTRNAKKQEVVDYFSQIRMDVESIKDDQKMRRFFDQLQKGSDQNIEYAVDIHYVLEYSEFYDILFVDEGGFVFHSIKKEDDNQTNLLTSNLNPKLTRALQASEDEQFAEFTYYGPSGEPAAFFAVSLEENETHLGWFVLQCAANNVNAILTDRKDLGRTGEVYLVNQDKLMLTDSRFVEDSTILRQEVDTLAVREAFRVASGNKIIEDYRGVKVFSSYEKFDLFGSTWVIIAEIDESEVLTEYYRKHKAYFDAEIVRYLSEQTSQRGKAHYLQRKERRIDIKEFDKVERSQTFVLTTKGVATCTAVAIVYPDKFGYLAHL